MFLLFVTTTMLEAVQVKMFLYGVMMTTIPIAVGFVIAKYVLHLRTEELVCVIAGGMTSTPAVGSLLQKNTFPVNMTAYSMTYIGALFTVVIGMRKIFA